MTSQSTVPKSKQEGRKKRKQTSLLETENQDGEKQNGYYMTRSKQETAEQMPDQCPNDAEQANGNLSLESQNENELVPKRKVPKSQKSSQIHDKTNMDVTSPVHATGETENADDEKGECEICHEQFDNLRSLTMHLRKHHVKENTCKICNQTLSSTSSLDRHMLRHSKERPYPCQYCGQTFTTNGNMNRHMHIHEEKMHETSQENGSAIPKTKAKTRSGKMNRQMQKQNASEMDTDLSSNTGETIPKAHKEKKSPPSKKPAAKGSKSKSTNSDEEEDVKDGFYDIISRVPFSSKKFSIITQTVCEEETVELPSHLQYKCKLCNKAFPDEASWDNHEKMHLEKNRPSRCSVCRTFVSQLSQHNLMYHPSSPNSKMGFLTSLNLCQRTEEVPESLEISECDNIEIEALAQSVVEAYVAKRRLSQELPEHTSIDGNENICPEEKSPIEKQKCAENSNDFADITSIVSNVSVAPIASEQSDVDENTFTVLQITESKDEEASRNSFGNSSEEKKDEQKVKKTYKCEAPGCIYTSFDRSSVARHARTHTKEHPFICSICGCEFTTKTNGERHARKIHNIENPGDDRIIDYNEKSNSTEPKVCKYCNVDFHNERVLQHHYRSINNSCPKKPYTCAKCRLGFATKNNYNRHFNKKHSNPNLTKEELANVMKSFCIKFEQNRFKIADDVDLNCSSEPSNSSQEERHSFSDEDRVNAAEGLVSLSQSTQPQPYPLDLSIHALDLSPPKSSWMPSNSRLWDNTPIDLTCKQSSSLALPPPPRNTDDSYSYETQLGALKKKASKRVKCEFCDSDFSLKTNKERHVKNKHREQWKAQERGGSMGNNKPPIPTATKKALMDRVLQNTDNNKQQIEIEDGMQMNGKSVVKSENLRETEAHSDLENVDLASVSSVINTANSPRFNQYLTTEEMSCSLLDKTNGDKESSFHQGKSDGSRRKSKENKHRCDVCQREFQWGSGLQRHVVKHTGYKPYVCHECRVRCTTKSNLTRHYKNKHGDSSGQKNAFQPHNGFSTGEVPAATIKAEVLDSSSDSSSPLRLCESNGNEMDFESESNFPDSLECKYCKTSYKTAQDLFNHTKELHHMEYAKSQGQDINIGVAYWKTPNK